MLAHHHRRVCLSFLSTDLPICSCVETSATLYQKDRERFHILLSQQGLPESIAESQNQQKGLIWLEASSSRVVMTMQGNSNFSYRHFWERGIYGVSRYWSNSYLPENIGSLRLRNFTRSLQLEGSPLPKILLVEYELWSEQLHLGNYLLHLEIDR